MPTHAERFANTLLITEENSELRELMLTEFRDVLSCFMACDEGLISIFADHSSAIGMNDGLTVCEDMHELVDVMNEINQTRPDQFEQLIASAEEQMAMIRALGD